MLLSKLFHCSYSICFGLLFCKEVNTKSSVKHFAASYHELRGLIPQVLQINSNQLSSPCWRWYAVIETWSIAWITLCDYGHPRNSLSSWKDLWWKTVSVWPTEIWNCAMSQTSKAWWSLHKAVFWDSQVRHSVIPALVQLKLNRTRLLLIWRMHPDNAHCAYPAFILSASLLPEFVYYLCDFLGQPKEKQHERVQVAT